MAMAGEHHPALEEYCNCIFELREDGVDVVQARVAERLDVSRPAVNEMMRHVEAEGLIEIDPSIALTAKGEAFAQRVVRIPEELEFEDGTLEFLENLGLPQADMALCSQQIVMVASLLTSMTQPSK